MLTVILMVASVWWRLRIWEYDAYVYGWTLFQWDAGIGRPGCTIKRRWGVHVGWIGNSTHGMLSWRFFWNTREWGWGLRGPIVNLTKEVNSHG